MRKNLFLFLLFGMSMSMQATAQDLTKDIKVTHLERDSFYNFYFVHDVDVKSEFDAEKKLWKVRLEEVINHKSLPEPHVETLWLKLDENCKPKHWDLQNFKINKHNFIVYLLKKKSKKK